MVYIEIICQNWTFNARVLFPPLRFSRSSSKKQYDKILFGINKTNRIKQRA